MLTLTVASIRPALICRECDAQAVEQHQLTATALNWYATPA
jgi:hypothetical protein